MKQIFMILCMVTLLIQSAHADAGADPESLLKKAVNAYRNVQDYTCTFHKKELLGQRIIEETGFLKFKKPQHIYIRFLEGPHKGMELTYVQGRNNDRMAVRIPGLMHAFPRSVDPYGSIAMREDRHPITEAGIGYILGRCEENASLASKEKNAVFTYEGIQQVDGVEADVVKSVFPKGKGYYAHIIYQYYGKPISLLLKISVLGWNDEFLEEYTFDDLKINVGLTEKDFPDFGTSSSG